MARIRPRACALAAACFVLCLGAVPAHAADPVVAAAGDISCDPDAANFNFGNGTADFCRQKYTAALVDGPDVNRVLALGDTQYERGTFAQFQNSYALSWGQAQIKQKTSPAVGNHEWSDPAGPAKGYFDYFNGVGVANGPAGERGKGYYSFDVGNWHLIALNSMCAEIGGCGAGSPQEQWLRADLAANAAPCTLAYWHHPLFNSGPEGNYNDTPHDSTALWQALYESGAELVLTGHAHHYERFAPQTPAGQADSQQGVREFIVGTGGKSLREIDTIQPNSQARDTSHYGVLKLVLSANGYGWTFVDEGGIARDSGSSSCHGPLDLTPPETSINSGPETLTRETNASFGLASSEQASTFACRLDGGAWTGCGSSAGYGGLSSGAHTFEARATDVRGNTDPTPAVRSFTVDATAPNTTITSGPSRRTRVRSASFSFSPSEDGSTFECRLDGGKWNGCSSPAAYEGLTSGKHRFEVRATDAAGNVDRSPATRDWSVRQRKADHTPWSYKVLAGDVRPRRDALRRLKRNDGRRLAIAAEARRSSPFVAGVETFASLTDEQGRSLERLTLHYDGGAGLQRAAIAVSVLNHRTDRWVKLFDQHRARGDRSFRWSVDGRADDYLSGSGTLRVRVRGKGRRAFRLQTDLVRLTVAY